MEALSKIQLLVWSKPLPAYNHFIGGAGEDYPTASALSTAMSIPPEAIQRFMVDEKFDILCRIDRNYTVFNNIFGSGKKMKDYFIDLDGRFVFSGSAIFSGKTNLKLRLLGLTRWADNSNVNGSPNLVFCPEVNSVIGNVFNSWANGCNRLYIPKLDNFTNVTSFLNNYNNNLNSSKKHIFYINSAISGSSNFSNAISKWAILKVVTNYDTPNKVTDLTASETNARMVKLTFTTPTAGTNPIDFYEFWFQKIGEFRPERKYLPSDSEIKNSNDYAFGLEPNSQYIAHICTVDTMYNGSGMFKDVAKRAISNEIIITTPALSGFQIGMSAYWKLNTNSFDFNGLNGYGGDVSLAYSGGYAKFGTGYIDIADNDAFSFTDGTNDTSAHIAFGFIWNDKAGTQFFIDKGSGVVPYEWGILAFGTNLRFYIGTFNNSGNIILDIPISSITAGVLNTFQFSYDGSKTTVGLKAYLNNVSVGTATMTGTYTGMVNSANQVRIGAGRNAGAPSKAKADMKELAIWKNRIMTPTEITEIDYRIKNNIPLI